MRSVAVVFPASMCAMIPMFRQRFRGMVRATVIFRAGLPARGYSLLRIPFRGPNPSLPNSLRRDQNSPRKPARLPAIVREGLVGLSHAVHVFLLLHRRAATVGRIEQFIRQLVDHALFAAV